MIIKSLNTKHKSSSSYEFMLDKLVSGSSSYSFAFLMSSFQNFTAFTQYLTLSSNGITHSTQLVMGGFSVQKSDCSNSYNNCSALHPSWSSHLKSHGRSLYNSLRTISHYYLGFVVLNLNVNDCFKACFITIRKPFLAGLHKHYHFPHLVSLQIY